MLKKRKKVYFAHAICLYGSNEEKTLIKQIKSFFPDSQIVDPGSYEDNLEKIMGGMEFCKQLINTCDSLVFSRLLGKITSGVGLEINHALTQKKPVFELKNNKICQTNKPVKYISRDDTIKLYSKWRTKIWI